MKKSIGFRHYRYLDDQGNINPLGGATMAYVEVPQEEGPTMFAAGVAYCAPSDNFQYTYGRNKARGRLVQAGSNSFSEVDDDKTFYLEEENREAFFSEMDSYMTGFGLSHL